MMPPEPPVHADATELLAKRVPSTWTAGCALAFGAQVRKKAPPALPAKMRACQGERKQGLQFFRQPPIQLPPVPTKRKARVAPLPPSSSAIGSVLLPPLPTPSTLEPQVGESCTKGRIHRNDRKEPVLQKILA